MTKRHLSTPRRTLPLLMALTSLATVGVEHASQAATVSNTDRLSAISTGLYAKVTVRLKGTAHNVTKVVPMPAGSLVSSSAPPWRR